MNKWHAVIGLEIHVQLLTQTKLFSRAPTRYGAKPNSQAYIVDLAMPGALPVLNQHALDLAIRFGLGVNASINQLISFDRKNYFYPDLPKGYQITQHYHPIVIGGYINIPHHDTDKKIRLHHAHLEEDAGKSIHDYTDDMTGVDFNRAGTPLLEIVSEPDLRTPDEAVKFLKKLHTLVVSMGISDGNMQEGSFRCDVNVSLRPNANAPFGQRVEIKNLNSFRFIEKAIHYEIKRQADVLDAGGIIKQETRLFNEHTQKTVMMREKEQAHDYRYHKDPDIPYVVISDDRIDNIRTHMPELPDQKATRYKKQLNLKADDADIFANDINLSHYFDKLCAESSLEPQQVANWLLGPVSALINKHKGHEPIEDLVSIKHQTELLQAITAGTISHSAGKLVLEDIWASNKSPQSVIEAKSLTQIQDETVISSIVQKVIDQNPKQLAQYQSGSDKLFGFFVGQIMKESKGKAAPEVVNRLLRAKLNEH
ncbi:MAG: Asp-tRNA(Asn)/Glu-tRNA(Gln) amidotransferase subunit GatB [Pseudomonadota bacterium]|nr:Asp-tRNA(Asn)/Glu-tRNA(Gln) amidotransferase subunit GatB [Pseudomonadota bacterium]